MYTCAAAITERHLPNTSESTYLSKAMSIQRSATTLLHRPPQNNHQKHHKMIKQTEQRAKRPRTGFRNATVSFQINKAFVAFVPHVILILVFYERPPVSVSTQHRTRRGASTSVPHSSEPACSHSSPEELRTCCTSMCRLVFLALAFRQDTASRPSISQQHFVFRNRPSTPKQVLERDNSFVLATKSAAR